MNLKILKGFAIPPIEGLFNAKMSCPIDLENFLNQNSLVSEDLKVKLATDYIKRHLKLNKAKMAYGGYLEKRSWYKRSDLFKKENDKFRNIHIGIDVWVKEGTDVIAPLDATVQSFRDNNEKGNYGPTVILKHQFENSATFYTLYGHLNRKSLRNLNINKIIKRGESFSEIGNHAENGNWPPHLHFQIITDIQSNFGDFPGVVSEKDKDFYQKICPSPYDLFTLPYQ